MRAIAETYGGGGSCHFLLRHHMLQIAQAQAAIRLVHGDAVQAKRAHGGPQVAGEPVLGVDLSRQRGDMIGGKTGGAFADHVRMLAQSEIEVGHWHLSCAAP